MGKNRGMSLPTMGEDTTGEIFEEESRGMPENVPSKVEGSNVIDVRTEQIGGEPTTVLTTEDGEQYTMGVDGGFNDAENWTNVKQNYITGDLVLDDKLMEGIRNGDVNGAFYQQLINNYDDIFGNNYEYGETMASKMLDIAYDSIVQSHPNWNKQELGRAYGQVSDYIEDNDPSEYVPEGVEGMVSQLEYEFYNG